MVSSRRIVRFIAKPHEIDFDRSVGQRLAVATKIAFVTACGVIWVIVDVLAIDVEDEAHQRDPESRGQSDAKKQRDPPACAEVNPVETADHPKDEKHEREKCDGQDREVLQPALLTWLSQKPSGPQQSLLVTFEQIGDWSRRNAAPDAQRSLDSVETAECQRYLLDP